MKKQKTKYIEKFYSDNFISWMKDYNNNPNLRIAPLWYIERAYISCTGKNPFKK